MLPAAFEDGSTWPHRRSSSGRRSEAWERGVRAGLTALLWLLDREPGLGRLLIVDGLGLGPRTLRVRRRVLAQAADAIDEGRAEARAGREPPPLTAEGTVGAVLAVVHDRLFASQSPATEPPRLSARGGEHQPSAMEAPRGGARGGESQPSGTEAPRGGARAGEDDGRPLTELTGSLMALIVHPYLGSAASRRELQTATAVEPVAARRLPADPFKDLPIRLTYRTALVLSSIAQSPGASSRQVADASGITDPGQISRLLTRLRRTGLIQDSGVGPAKGMARAWSLTERGEDLLQATGQV